MGKKRHVIKTKPKTAKEKFAARLRELAEGREAKDIAGPVGVSDGAVHKWLRGFSLPDLEYWPKLAEVFGLKNWRELLPLDD